MGWPTKLGNQQLLGSRTLRVSQRFDKCLIFYMLPGYRIEILRVLHGAMDLDALFEREA